MIRLIQRRLIIPRGDTGTFTVPLLATAQTGDASVFTIFDQKTQKKVFEKIVHVNGEAIEIVFSHADTVNLPAGDYVWDIKFYKDPVIIDNVLVDGTEIDSYYAAFKLPVCEIRQTGDTLLIADDAPTSTIAPDQLNIILAATDEINTAKREVINAAEVVETNTQTASDAATSATADAARAESAAEAASTSASAASQSATNASNAKDSAVAANTAAQQALLDANLAATTATNKAAEATASAAAASDSATAASTSASAASSSATNAATSANNAAASVTEMEALVRAIPTNVSEFENDAGYITAAALPTKVSDLTDDSGHYTKPTGGIPASDLAETYLTSFTETDPTVSAWAKAAQKPSYTAAEVGAPTVAEMQQAIEESDNRFIVHFTLTTQKLFNEIEVSSDKTIAEISAAVQNQKTLIGQIVDEGSITLLGSEVMPGLVWFQTVAMGKFILISGMSQNGVDVWQHASPTLMLAEDDGDYTAVNKKIANVNTPTEAKDAANKQYVDTAIANINTMKIHICTAAEYNSETGVPTIVNPDIQTFYLIPGGERNNLYIEWVYLDNKWEQFGSATVKIDVATVEDTMAIITEYDEQEDEEGMIFEMTFVEDGQNTHYISVDDASAIINAFKAAKNVVIHFPAYGTYLCNENYLLMTSYEPETVDDGGNVRQHERIILGGFYSEDDQISGYIKVGDTRIEDGKLIVPVYVD